MKRSAVTTLLSLFLGCLAYRLFIYYKPYIPPMNMDSMGGMIVIITCTLVPVAAGLLAIASVPRPKTTRRHPIPSVQTPQRSAAAQRPTPNPKEEKLSRQLIELLHGDQDAAQWLLHTSKQNNPGKAVEWHLEQVIQEVRHHSSTQPTAPLPQPPQRQQPAAPSLKQAELHRQLVGLLHGDADTAKRLIDLSIEKNPLRDTEWHLDKVINDLVRDRGGKPAPKPYERDYRDYRDC